MAAKKGNYQIPFNKDGNQQDYPACWYVQTGETRLNAWGQEYQDVRPEGPYWRDNFEFEDTLELVGYGRGRSSITFGLRRSDGTTVTMFVSDFYEAAFHMVGGKITGRFTFVKKGQNYGCKMLFNEGVRG